MVAPEGRDTAAVEHLSMPRPTRRPTRLLGGLATVAGLLAGIFFAVPAHAAVPSWLAAKQAALAAFRPPPAAAVTLTPTTGGAWYHAYSVNAVVHVGPGRATACTIVGELLVPDGVDAAHPAAVVMDTNGFGGSYSDSTTFGQAQAASHAGFIGLTYSGLGFGGSGCQIELDSPQWDGMAASELISWLGEQPEVRKDGTDDPRVGMIGGSYGGAVQLAAASIDPRLDAIVPVITWNDLAYSLAPNNDSLAPVRGDREPGALKWEWASLFFGDGVATPVENDQPSRLTTTCPGFDPAICQAFATSIGLGYTDPATVALLRGDSMVTYHSRLHLPVLLAQGEQDSLFDIQEAVDNYRELQAQGDPVTLVLQSWGHSNSTPAPGELSLTAPFQGYEDTLIFDFFDKWLDGADVSTGAPVQYFRPWVSYEGNAAPAYGTAPSWPVGSADTLLLSANGALVDRRSQVVAGADRIVNPGGSTGSSYSETSGVQTDAPFSGLPASDAPGTYASYQSSPLAGNLDVVGVPTLRVTVSSSVPAGVDPATDPVLFAKLYDVSPSGTATLVDRLVAPVRVATTSRPVTITLPGIVHRYPAGDRLDLVLAAGDDAYLGNRVPDVYTVTVSGAAPGVLTIPAVAPSAERDGTLPTGEP
jgi:predicted acyl esterase